nr:MAG TPA: hypothetical protein [Caudoviricetes sp.]
MVSFLSKFLNSDVRRNEKIFLKYVENSSFSRQLPQSHILITISLADVYGKAVNATNS